MYKMNRLVTVFIAIALIISFAACSDNSPKAAAQQFLTSFYHMEYEKAREVSTPKTKEMVDMIEQFAINYPDSTKQEAKSIKVEILDVKEDGDKAVATYQLSNEPGQQKLNLVKQNGTWLADFSKLDNVPEVDEETENEMIEDNDVVEGQ